MGDLESKLVILESLRKIKNKALPGDVYVLFLGATLGAICTGIKLAWYMRCFITLPGYLGCGWRGGEILLLIPQVSQSSWGHLFNYILGVEVLVSCCHWVFIGTYQPVIHLVGCIHIVSLTLTLA